MTGSYFPCVAVYVLEFKQIMHCVVRTALIFDDESLEDVTVMLACETSIYITLLAMSLESGNCCCES